MSKTKTLPPGIPIADAKGNITAMSVEQLAKLVGGCAATTSHTSGDFNDFTDPGFHTITGSSDAFQNRPVSGSISRSFLLVSPSVSNSLVQIYMNSFTNKIMFRSVFDGEWREWKEITATISGGGSNYLTISKIHCFTERRTA